MDDLIQMAQTISDQAPAAIAVVVLGVVVAFALVYFVVLAPRR